MVALFFFILTLSYEYIIVLQKIQTTVTLWKDSVSCIQLLQLSKLLLSKQKIMLLSTLTFTSLLLIIGTIIYKAAHREVR